MVNPEISAFLQERIDANDFPSAVYLVAEGGRICYQDALGYAVLEAKPFRATNDTVFDLASVTKVLVTGLIAARLIERRQLSLDDDLAKLLPKIVGSDRSAITIRQLLTHTSGLIGWVPLYLLVDHPSKMVEAVLMTDRSYPNRSVIYSD